MTIDRLLHKVPLAAEDISCLVAAYEATLKALELASRSDPMTEIVAWKIIEIGQAGVRDPIQISKLALKALGTAGR